jgi:hypothetical protein
MWPHVVELERSEVISQFAAAHGNPIGPGTPNPAKPGQTPQNVKQVFVAEPGKTDDPNPVLQTCTAASVAVNYSWSVWRAGVPAEVTRVQKRRTFHCRKSGDKWSCRDFP